MKCCGQELIISTNYYMPIYVESELKGLSPKYIASCPCCGCAAIGETEAIAKENYKAGIRFKEKRIW